MGEAAARNFVRVAVAAPVSKIAAAAVAVVSFDILQPFESPFMQPAAA